MLKITICDDNREHLRYTADLVRKELTSYQTELFLFSNAEELLNSIQQAQVIPDIAVLDILLDSRNGIDLAKQINRLLPACKIIFLTGYPEYATASYEAEHIWFVLKSVADNYIGLALQKALAVSVDSPDRIGITARISGKSFFLPLGNILYISRVGRKAQIVCKDCAYLVSSPPQTLINENVQPFLIRCHQGYWVNLRLITSLDKNEFVLEGNQHIPISRGFRDEARKRFFAYLSE